MIEYFYTLNTFRRAQVFEYLLCLCSVLCEHAVAGAVFSETNERSAVLYCDRHDIFFLFLECSEPEEEAQYYY